MSDTKKYKALGPIWHDGQVYSAGAFIPMTDKCAADLLGLKGVPRIEVIAEEAPVDTHEGDSPESSFDVPPTPIVQPATIKKTKGKR